MKQVKKIVITKSPQSPNAKPFVITIDDMIEFKENNSFINGFSGEIHLLDGSKYDFILTDNVWKFYHMLETGAQKTENKNVFNYVPPIKPGTFTKALDKFMVWKNSQ